MHGAASRRKWLTYCLKWKPLSDTIGCVERNADGSQGDSNCGLSIKMGQYCDLYSHYLHSFVRRHTIQFISAMALPEVGPPKRLPTSAPPAFLTDLVVGAGEFVGCFSIDFAKISD